MNDRLEAADESDGLILLSEYTTTSGPLVWWPTSANVNSSSSWSKEATGGR